MSMRSFLTLVCILWSALLVVVPIAAAQSDEDSTRARVRAVIDSGHQLLKGSWNETELDSASVILDSALLLAAQHFGKRDTLIARALLSRALCDFRRDDLRGAERRFKEAISIWEERLGPNPPQIGNLLRMLGDITLSWSDYVATAEYYNRAHAILKDAPDDFLAPKSVIINNLGLLAKNQGRHAEEEQYYREALDLFREVYGDSSLMVAISHMNIGMSKLMQGETDEAQQWLESSLDLLNLTAGPDAYYTSLCLAALGDVYTSQGRYEQAQGMLNRSIAIREKELGPDHSDVGVQLPKLATFALAAGDRARAEELAERAVRITDRTRGGESKFTSFGLSVLASVYAHNGKFDASTATYHDLATRRQRFIAGIFTYASEEQKLRYIRKYPLVNSSFLSLAVQQPTDPAMGSSFEMVINGKGTVIDAIATERRVAVCADDPEIADLVVNHRMLCDNIATEVLSHSASDAKVARMIEAKDSIETVLSRVCANVGASQEFRTLTTADIAGAMTDDALLLEFVRYRDRDFSEPIRHKSWRPPHYGVFVIGQNGITALVSLGPAQRIDSLVGQFQDDMRTAAWDIYEQDEEALEQELAGITHRLWKLLIAPLEPHLGNVERLIIAPDGQLSLIPFGVLADSDGRYLVERFGISYVSSGRDLLADERLRPPATESALIVADPTYDADPAVNQGAYIAAADVGAVTRGGPCFEGLFQPLAASGLEAERIGATLKASGFDVQMATRDQATEDLLKSLQEPPAVLHMATHSYFCDRSTHSSSTDEPVNPLLISGMAFAGANASLTGDGVDPSRQEDGILTALEASGLNLVGTELVVLSSCQSGLGVVQSGEGVFGLRRAFLQAGAGSVMMSMYPVSDRATTELMDRFYRNWLAGTPKSRALHEATLAMLQERRQANGAAHPLFWGGFALVGDPD